MSAVLSSREGLAPQPPVGTAPFDDLFRDLIQLAERGRQLSLVVQLREFQGQLGEMARRYHSGDAGAVDGFLAEWQVEQQLRDSIERRPAPEACGGVAGLVDACRRDLNDLVRDETTKKQRFERRISLLAHLAQLEALAGAGVAGAVPFLSDGAQVVHADEVATWPPEKQRCMTMQLYGLTAATAARLKASRPSTSLHRVAGDAPPSRQSGPQKSKGGQKVAAQGLSNSMVRILQRAPEAMQDLPDDLSPYNTSLRSLERRGLVELARHPTRINAHGFAAWCWRRKAEVESKAREGNAQERPAR